MTKKIFKSTLFASFVIFIVTMTLIIAVLYPYFLEVQKKQMKIAAEITGTGLERYGEDFLKSMPEGDYRVTWIGRDGEIIYDSKEDASKMENHAGREEIVEALSEGYGESARFSVTMTERQMYVATRIKDGTVIRIAETQRSLISLLYGMIQPILFIGLFAALLALFLAYHLSKKVVARLNNVNLDEPLQNEEFEELKPLLMRIDGQQRLLNRKENELKLQREEFESVTENLSDGLIIASESGNIININREASAFFMSGVELKGKNILDVITNEHVREAAVSAFKGKRAEIRFSENGNKYLADASPVMSSGELYGISVLIRDITEKEKGEVMRREFTANVSHELKTPLHTISGCAELLYHKMVKPEDIDQFAAQIYTESKRLIRLVDDIIKLSNLDEGIEPESRENIDISKLAKEVTEQLEPVAKAADVELSFEGEPAQVTGVYRMLSSMIYNICDNAIKYNRDDGKVHVAVTLDEGSAQVTVTDTGVGIPAEEQIRIFERFYRVDKSRSKEVGGTGLGLSIVKHVAELHRCELSLKSEVGKGTEITVRFPAAEAADNCR